MGLSLEELFCHLRNQPFLHLHRTRQTLGVAHRGTGKRLEQCLGVTSHEGLQCVGRPQRLGAKRFEHSAVGFLAGLTLVFHDDGQTGLSRRIEVRGRPACERVDEHRGIFGGGSCGPEGRINPRQFVRKMPTRLDPLSMAWIVLRNGVFTQE